MADYRGLPWTHINDYLLEIGASKSMNELCSKALSGLEELVPFDNNGVFAVIDSKGYMSQTTLVECAKWSELYNNYYWRFQPSIPSTITAIYDWRYYSNAEFVVDFLYPQGIGTSLATYHLASDIGSSGGFALHRNRHSPCFTQRDSLILEVIQPHLSNYFAIHTVLSTYDYQLPDAYAIASEYKCLTRREAEIVSLLCRRYSTGMIVSKLMISKTTVYRHLANIFSKLNVFCRDELLEKLLVGLGRKEDHCKPK